MVECFVIYLVGYNWLFYEVLFGNDKDIVGEYEWVFVGMIEVDCFLEILFDVCVRLWCELL